MSRNHLFLVFAASVLLICRTVYAVEQGHICRFCEQHHGLAALAAGGQGEGRKYAPPRYVDILHWKLDVTPDFVKRTIAGTATIEFAPVGKPLSELKLDAVNLDIREVRSSTSVADYSSSAKDLVIVFEKPIAVGERHTVEILYAAEPRQGLFFRTPELGYDPGDTHLYSQGEPEQASHWFPCHDYPNERSSTELICHVPPEMTVLSNGTLISGKVDSQSGLKAVHWRQNQPHVAYLITLAAGYFDKLEDASSKVPLAFYVQPSLAKYAANSFANTADIMSFLTKEIGVAYPWDKYYQVTVSDCRFGGMENTSMTTLSNRSLYSDESENVNADWVRILDAHEMTHQWFGDYVTCKDWSHLWLNEGFATYYSRLYDEHRFGRDDLLYAMYRDAAGRVLPKHGDRRPIVFNQYKTPYEQFDFRAYPKGSWVLHMLRSQLGEQLYRDCIRTYLEKHAYTSVVTADLSKVIEDVSGRSFDRFFDQWVYHARHPSLKVSYKWIAAKKLAHVTVEQTQATDDKVLLFEFPTSLRFKVGEQTIDRPITVNDSKNDFYVQLEQEPTQVRFDPEYTVLADIEFKKSDKLLLTQLANKEDAIGRILAIHQFAERKSLEAIEAIGGVLRNDPFWGVRIEAAKALEKAGRLEALEQLAGATTADDARVRRQVAESIGGFQRPRAKELLVAIANQERNPAVAASAIRLLGKYRDEDAQQVVESKLKSNSFRNQLADAAIAALGEREDSTEAVAVMQTLDDRSEQLSSRGFGNGLKTLAKLGKGLEANSPERIEVERFLRKQIEHTKTPIRSAAIESLGILGDSRSVGVLESLARDTSGDRAAEAASNALKVLRANKSAVPKELADLRKQFDDLKKESEKLRQEFDELKAAKAGEK